MNAVWIMLMGVIFLNPGHEDPAKKEELLMYQQLAKFQSQAACQLAVDNVTSSLGESDYLFFTNSSGKQAVEFRFDCIEERTQ